MMNQAIHTLDLMQYLAGSPVESVRGSTAQLLDYGLEVEDTAAARICFAGGAVGLFTASVACYGDLDVQLDVQCRHAGFAIRDKALYITQAGGTRRLTTDRPAATGKRCYGSSHETLIRRFYESIQNGGDDYIHPHDAAPVIRIIDAICESHRTGRAVKTGGSQA